jgi:predicted Zn finger-like uncharacterized protein
MKITCDQCSARYSVGDDKISGRVFKIRCKRCSHVIIVRGEAQQPVAQADDVPADAWYAIVEGAQVGPWTLAELRRRRDAGDVDGETLVWREGLADWQSYALVPELVPSVRLEARDVFTAQAAPAPVSGDAPTEPQERRAALRAERNESSVLFSISNLAALAAPQPSPAPGHTATAQTEGSGLIDIQRLARTMSPAAAAPRSAHAVGSLDDLPSYAPVGFVEPAVLVPARRGGDNRRLVVALGASLGVLAIVAVILIVLVVRRDGSTPTAEAAQPAPTAPIAEAPAKPAPPEVKPAPPPTTTSTTTPTTTTPATTTPTTTTTPSRTTTTTPSRTTTTTPSRTTTTTPSTSRTTTTTPSTSRTTTAPSGAAPTEVECIMTDFKDERCAPYRPKRTTPPPTTTTNLPEQLTRDGITAGLGTISVAACSGKSSSHGEVKVSIKVTPEGRVSGVTIKASPDEALSACVVAAASRGSFPKTQRGGSFFYVWRL